MVLELRLRPPGVLLGGCWLAFLAAAVNTHFLFRTGVSVSHLTGDLSRLGMDAVAASRGPGVEPVLLAVTLVGFVAGATLAGLVIGNPTLSFERPYGRSIMGIGAAMVAAALLEPRVPIAAAGVAAAGCGFQNGLATRYRGLVLRTTHVTGILTDIGQLLGMRLGGHVVEGWKIVGQVAILCAFFLGAVGGAVLQVGGPERALFVLGALYTSSGLVWTVRKRRITAHASPTDGPGPSS